jgi:hypothetical protein
LVACGLCCGLPLVTLLGGVGLAAAVGAVLEVFERFAFVLAVLALGGVAAVWLRRRHRRTCDIPNRTVDLGMPGMDRVDRRGDE